MMTTADDDKFFGYEVALDNCSQVNICHPRFLKNVRKETGSFKGADSKLESSATSEMGHLEGFHDCIASEDVRISILCQADVESKYKITYLQEKS